MKWPNVKLIFARELRDQMRDRRTLFTVAVMPMILYPLMGMAMLQVAQFMREYPTKVWVVGQENLPVSPALIVEGSINEEFAPQRAASLLELSTSREGDQTFHDLIREFREQSQMAQAQSLVDQLIQAEMRERGVDVAMFVPKPIELSGDKLQRNANSTEGARPPSIYIFQNTAVDQSRIGAQRLKSALGLWQRQLVRNALAEKDINPALVDGIAIAEADVADKDGKKAAAWSKIFPFIIMIWSLTGAFYPAIDLCAGEKERGTFETLLSSPAARSEIAIGKLLTVMTFSIATSVLNLLSMGFTGLFVVSRMGASVGGGLPMGAPPIASIGWLLLALIPISALFSAVALAAAAFARSSKEGQYYLVPLMMISMPLMMVPMLPAAKLDFGSSLIPVSGLMLLLRGLIEGQYSECLRFAGPVCIVTLACCWFSIRWVVHQFNSESVLFRPSERFGVSTWFRHVMRERNELPSFGSAILCALVILVGKFFIGFVIQTPLNFADFSKQTIIILVATIAVPAVMMALVLTRNPRKSLRLHSCTMPMACAAVLAAVLLNPMFTWVTSLVMAVYPPADDLFALKDVVANILESAPNIWAILAVFALAPAIFEELAFRGFILSGFESMRNKWQAVVLTSLAFGIAHGVLQQSMITFAVGLVLGLIAVQTRSIIPCILFHLTHNSLAVLLSSAKSSVIENSLILDTVLTTENGVNYQYAVIPGVAMTVLGIGVLIWFLRLDGKERPVLGSSVSELVKRLMGRRQMAE